MTPKEEATIVAKTISEIRSYKVITSEIIEKACEKFGASESYIRKVSAIGDKTRIANTIL